MVFYLALEKTFTISFKARERNWAELTFAKTLGTVAGDSKKKLVNREQQLQRRRQRRQFQKPTGYMIKTTALHVHHAF